MNYTQFAEDMLIALYQEAEQEPGQVTFEEVTAKYGFPQNLRWIEKLTNEWEANGLVDVDSYIGSPLRWHAEISGYGLREVERRFRNSGPDGLTRILSPVLNVGVPASDRLVPLNHNSPEYIAIKRGLEDLCEQLRQDNEVGETAAERDRLLRSLGAAKELWSAAELYVIQIRIGVVMAVEDATKAIVKVGKAVGAALLVDLIKRYVKNATGIDF